MMRRLQYVQQFEFALTEAVLPVVQAAKVKPAGRMLFILKRQDGAREAYLLPEWVKKDVLCA
jgi:hypothetical protein